MEKNELIKIVHKAQKAQDALDNSLYNEAFAEIESNLLLQMRDENVEDDRVLALRRQLIAISAVRKYLHGLIKSGKKAQKELDDAERKPRH